MGLQEGTCSRRRTVQNLCPRLPQRLWIDRCPSFAGKPCWTEFAEWAIDRLAARGRWNCSRRRRRWRHSRAASTPMPNATLILLGDASCQRVERSCSSISVASCGSRMLPAIALAAKSSGMCAGQRLFSGCRLSRSDGKRDRGASDHRVSSPVPASRIPMTL